MRFAKCSAVGAIVFAISLTAAYAQPQDQDHAAHHPDQGAAAAQSPSEPAGSGGMPMSGPSGEMPMMKGMGGNMQPMMPMMQMMRERMAEHMESRMGWMIPLEHVKGHIAFLKAELGITDAQQPQWSAFADALQTQALNMRTMHEQMMKGGMPTTWPERLAHQEQMLSARLAAVKAIQAPARALYSVLSPEQEKKADELLGGPMGMM